MASTVESDHRSSWRAAVAVTAVAAAALRLTSLGASLWYDEIVTLVTSVRRPVTEIVTTFPGVNQHPLYSLAAHLSTALFGESAWALRLPAALFGAASIVIVYRLGCLVATRSEGWAAAAILTVSYHHVWFSQNARGYTMLGFFVSLSTFLLILAGRTGRRRCYTAYALVLAAGTYTHLTMALVAAGHGLALTVCRLAGWNEKLTPATAPLVRAWLVAGALSALAYAPFASSLLALARADDHHDDATVATVGWAVSEAFRSAFAGAGAPVVLLAIALIAIGTAGLMRRQPFATGLIIAPAAVTIAAIAALGQPVRPRFVFFLSGGLAIFAACGLRAGAEWLAAHLPARTAPRPSMTMVASTLLFVALSAAALPRAYGPKQDFAGVVAFLQEEEARGAMIAGASVACRPFAIYYGRPDWPCLETLDDWRVFVAASKPVLVAHTLTEYVFDTGLRQRLLERCSTVRRFRGTLGGGDIVVCQPVPEQDP